MATMAAISNRKPTISIEMSRLDRIGAVPNLRGDRSSRGAPLFTPSNVRSIAVGALALLALSLLWMSLFGDGGETYSVVFDAGSTGNRVHVFKFAPGPDGPVLVDEVFRASKPGFSAVAADPAAAAALLDPLIATARDAVPANKRARTKLTLRATAGLRLLPEGPEAAAAVLDAVRARLRGVDFLVPDDGVTLLDGADEGAYGWIAVNYLLDRLDRSEGVGDAGADTVAVADLGGGSAQITYAVDPSVAEDAPEGYVRAAAPRQHIYAHSFKGYGIMAARAKILAFADADAGTHPCVPAGFRGGCESRCYGLAPGETYVAVAREEGADFEQCLASVLEAMDADATCDRAPCSFGGAWTTPRKSRVYAMSYLYERAAQAKVTTFPEDASVPVVVTPGLYRDAGKRVCAVAAKDIARTYPDADQEHAAYLCLDVAYAYALLASGFGLRDDEELTLVDKIEHGGKPVEAAWALGDAVVSMREDDRVADVVQRVEP